MDNLVKWAVVLGAGCILIAVRMHDAKADSLPLAVQVIACESAGRMVCNNHEPDGKRSCGIAQFQRPTFNWMRHKAGVDTLDYNDPLHQIALLNWALENGYGNHWTCYRKIKSEKWHITPALNRKMRQNLYIRLMFGGVR